MNSEILLKRELVAKNICAELNNFVDLKHTLISVIEHIKEASGIEAVSIRLHEDQDYPYFVYDGFADSFIQKENTLCSGISEDGKPILDCVCGNVIHGNYNSVMPFYTTKGSFVTNNTTQTTTDYSSAELMTEARNYCQKAGYKSVGLFPIKTRSENIGLIQMNDTRPDIFSDDLVEFIEMIGEQVGVAIENALLFEKIKEKNTELQNTLDDLNHMQAQLLEAKKVSALAELVSGVAHEIYYPGQEVYDKLQSSIQVLSKLRNSDLPIEIEDDINKIAIDNRNAFKNIEKINTLVTSFKSIAFDQFQESRHLINLNRFINDIITVVKPNIKGKNIDFDVDCNENIEYMGFSGALSQVITQLIHNSYSHGFKDLTEGRIRINCNVNFDDDALEIIYSDNGIGVPVDISHKLFEPFFTTERKTHTGLGLYIAQNLIENKLQGTIKLQKCIGGECSFELKLNI